MAPAMQGTAGKRGQVHEAMETIGIQRRPSCHMQCEPTYPHATAGAGEEYPAEPPSRTSSAGDAFMRTASNPSQHHSAPHTEEVLRVATWNVAAVNNNPFEYWVTHPDPAYNALMQGVQDFIDDPGARDVAVEQIFDDAMAQQLFADMRHHAVDHVDEVAGLWESDYRSRRLISGFIKDSALGKKRLASMPDRITNTIRSTAGNHVMRPTVINYFDGDLSTTQKWWAAWRKFIFRTEVELFDGKQTGTTLILKLLDPISSAKYPALTPDEERISIPLQVLCLAIFDAILVHVLNTVSKDKWQGIRSSLAEAFLVNKDKQVPLPPRLRPPRYSSHDALLHLQMLTLHAIMYTAGRLNRARHILPVRRGLHPGGSRVFCAGRGGSTARGTL